jgi:hypothetical protein
MGGESIVEAAAGQRAVRTDGWKDGLVPPQLQHFRVLQRAPSLALFDLAAQTQIEHRHKSLIDFW